MIPSEGFETAAYKLMISDLNDCVKRSDGTFDLKISSQTTGLKQLSQQESKTVQLKLVWVQGVIIGVKARAGINHLVIEDGTGEAWLAHYDETPGSDHNEIKPGGYIGVLGQLIETKPIIVLRAAKVMVLHGPDKAILEKMWSAEVRDVKAYLLGHYSGWTL